jgi:hypothetical protein
MEGSDANSNSRNRHAALSNNLKFEAIFDTLSRIMATLSIAALCSQTWKIGLGAVSEAIIGRYEAIIHGIAELTSPLIEYLASKFRLTIHLNKSWPHVSVLLWLYFSPHALSANYGGLPKARRWYFLWGAAVAIVAGLLYGFFNPTSGAGVILASFIPIFGYILYTLVNSFRAARLYSPNKKIWFNNFKSAARHSLAFAVAGTIIVSLTLLHNVAFGLTNSPRYGVFILLAFVIFLSFYRIIVNDRWGRYDPISQEPWGWRALYTREAAIGWIILLTIVAAIAVILLGVGEKFLLGSNH